MDSLLDIKQLTIFSGEETPLLKDIRFHISRGEVLGLMGPSGAGKSLCALSLAGLLPDTLKKRTTGEIFFVDRQNHKHELLSTSEKEWANLRGREIAVLFQEPGMALNPVKTCGRQLRDVLASRGFKKIGRRNFLDYFAKVGLENTQRIAKAYPHELSGGQQQRVLLAMILALSPSLLIVDEPTSSLDQPARRGILTLLRKMVADYNMGLLFISHDQELVEAIADRVIYIKDGVIDPDVVTSPPLNQIAGNELDEVTENPGNQKDSHESSAPLLELKNISITYRNASFWTGTTSLEAVKQVNLTLEEGEILAVIGMSGSGKSSLARLLVRLLEKEEGSIFYRGKPAEYYEDLNWKRKIQLVFQQPGQSLDPLMKVGDQLAEVIIRHQGKKQVRQKCKDIFRRLSLPSALLNRKPHELSGGQKQRVAIARALAVQPEILILDEAVSALDRPVQHRILSMLKSLSKELNLSILMVTHDLSLAFAYADRVAVLANGSVVESGLTSAILTHPEHPHTRKLVKGQKLS